MLCLRLTKSQDYLMDEFVTYTLNVSEIGLSPDTVFKQIRQTDFSPENPIVSITFEIFETVDGIVGTIISV